MKRIYATHVDQVPVICDGKFVDQTRSRDVRVMAQAEGYAMVRIKGAAPYVCPISELVIASRTAAQSETKPAR